MSDLWTEASRDAEGEALRQAVTAARVGVQPYWGFLAAAADEADYGNRKAIAAEEIDAVVADAVGTNEHLASKVRDEVIAALDDEYATVQALRLADAEGESRARIEANLVAESDRMKPGPERDKFRKEIYGDDYQENEHYKAGYEHGKAGAPYEGRGGPYGPGSPAEHYGRGYGHGEEDRKRVAGTWHEAGRADPFVRDADRLSAEAGAKDRYRIVPSDKAGYGPGRHVVQKWYPDNKLWHDVGDPRDTREEAEEHLRNHQKESSTKNPENRCPHCGKWFMSVSQKDAHIAKQHSDKQAVLHEAAMQVGPLHTGDSIAEVGRKAREWMHKNRGADPTKWKDSSYSVGEGLRETHHPDGYRMRAYQQTTPHNTMGWAVKVETGSRDASLHTAADPFQIGDRVRLIGGFENGLEGTVVANEPKTAQEYDDMLGFPAPYGPRDRPYRYVVQLDDDPNGKTIGGLDPTAMEKIGSLHTAVTTCEGCGAKSTPANPVLVRKGFDALCDNCARDRGVLYRDKRATLHTAPGGGVHGPYYVRERGGNYVVVNAEGEVKGTHDSREEALDQQRALYANIPEAREQAEERHGESPPKAVSDVGRKGSLQTEGATWYANTDAIGNFNFDDHDAHGVFVDDTGVTHHDVSWQEAQALAPNVFRATAWYPVAASLEVEAVDYSPASGMGKRHDDRPWKATHRYEPIGWDQFDARPHPGSKRIKPGSEVMLHGKMDPSGHLMHISDATGNHQTVDKRSLKRRGSSAALEAEAVGEFDELGGLFQRQINDMAEQGVTRSGQPVTRPCRYCGADATFDKLYASYPTSYANYECPSCGKETHYRPEPAKEGSLQAEADRDRATRPRLGDQTACRYCDADIEYHGGEHGWIDRGGNKHCANSGMAGSDENGAPTYFPEGQRHKPYSDRVASLQVEAAGLIKGRDLKPEQKAQVLRAYPYRWTHENHGVEGNYPAGSAPTIPKQSDDDWVNAHSFRFNNKGDRHLGGHAEPHYMADEPHLQHPMYRKKAVLAADMDAKCPDCGHLKVRHAVRGGGGCCMDCDCTRRFGTKQSMLAHESDQPHGAHDDSGNHADGTKGDAPPADGDKPFPPKDDAQQQAPGEGELQQGQQVVVHYVMPDGTKGDCPATVQTADPNTATLTYENGTFSVTKQGDGWADSQGATFTFDVGGEDKPTDKAPDDKKPPFGKDTPAKPVDSDKKPFPPKKKESTFQAGATIDADVASDRLQAESAGGNPYMPGNNPYDTGTGAQPSPAAPTPDNANDYTAPAQMTTPMTTKPRQMPGQGVTPTPSAVTQPQPRSNPNGGSQVNQGMASLRAAREAVEAAVEAASYRNDPHWITAEHSGRCSTPGCNNEIKPGERVFHYPNPRSKATYCTTHSEGVARRAESEMADEDFMGG